MYYNLVKINETILKAQRAISLLGLRVIKDKKRKGYSDYLDFFIQYNLVLNCVIDRKERDVNNLDFQKLVESLTGVISALSCGGSMSYNLDYYSIDCEKAGEVVVNYILLEDSLKSFTDIRTFLSNGSNNILSLSFTPSLLGCVFLNKVILNPYRDYQFVNNTIVLLPSLLTNNTPYEVIIQYFKTK